MEQFRDMAENSYGYGCWDGPYWFLGPEQGMSKSGSDTLEVRNAAWHKSDRLQLDDCKKFHEDIGESRWHGEAKKPSGRPYLQSTWRRLIAASLGYEGKDAGELDQWAYQRNELGRHNGKTCIIELSGLAATSLADERDRKKFLGTRLDNVNKKIDAHGPAFLILYGKTPGCAKAWAELSANSDELLSQSSIAQIRKRGDSLIAWTGHPTMQKVKDWYKLGHELKSLKQMSA
ncbi:MAG TPA: hypothetical protein VIJ79_12870 [Acidobacteriaceae bacterium]